MEGIIKQVFFFIYSNEFYIYQIPNSYIWRYIYNFITISN